MAFWKDPTSLLAPVSKVEEPIATTSQWPNIKDPMAMAATAKNQWPLER